MSRTPKDIKPPWLVMKFFRWFCSWELQQYVEGDLIELYQERVNEKGRLIANWKFLVDVVLLFRPGIIGFAKEFYSNNNTDMIRNYLKVGARNLWKDRFYTGINLFGLSIGLAFSFLVLLLVNHEFSYEDFYQNRSHIKRLGIHYNVSGKEDTYSNVPRPFGPTFKQEFPEVVQYTRVAGVNGLDVHSANLMFRNDYFLSNNIYVADSTFFKVFDTELIAGNRESVLQRPNTVVLSASLAETIFGSGTAIGQVIEVVEDGRQLEVTGVFKDIPSNTHLPYDALVSWNGYYPEERNSRWFGAHVYTYIRLQEPYQAVNISQKYPAFYQTHMAEYFAQLNATGDLVIQNIEDIHLHSDLIWEANQNGDLTSVFVLLAIGVFLVIIALVNYLNLSLARNSLRKKEISIRKVVGASRFNISGQFFVETLLFTFISCLMALVIVKLIYGEFLSIGGVDVLPFATTNLLLFVGATLILGMVVSVYPSLILSGVRLVEGLKGRSKASRESGRLQRGLVILQFTISTIVILFTFVVKHQLEYVEGMDLGFKKDDIVVFDMNDSTLFNNSVAIRDRVKGVNGVSNASFTSDRPSVRLNHFIINVEDNGEYNAVASQYMQVDFDFASTIDLKLVEGRAFIEGSQNDMDWSYMINETAKEKFGWDEEAIGKKMFFSNDAEGNPRYMTSIGVFKDFNVGSLHTEVEPVVIFYNKESGNQLLVRLDSESQSVTISDIESILQSHEPTLPVAYDYLSVELDRQYSDEQRLSRSMAYLSALTIIISVLGFIGLLSFAISKRQTEIGVRKVLGATAGNVTLLFYKQILVLILAAELIAIPVNQFISNQWLNSFQYRSFPSFIELGLVLLVIIVLSLGIMGFQVLKVAFMNPVDVIKEE